MENKIVLVKDKNFDKLIAQYKKEKTVNLVFTFDSILAKLIAEKKLDKILEM